VRASGFCDADEATMGEGVEHREADLALLRELVRDHEGDLSEVELDAFGDMLDAVSRGRKSQLTDKQRAWLERAADRLDVAYTPRGTCTDPLTAAQVPVGRPVPTPRVLRDLPKRPPGCSYREMAENDEVEAEIMRGKR
jgi:hypothetical protein